MILQYFYPIYNQNDSFSIVAKHHIQFLKKHATVYEISNTARINYNFSKMDIVAFQPWLYVADRFVNKVENAKRTICIEVADSDELSADAITRLQYCDRIIVPSKNNVEIFSKYFDKDVIYYISHGVEDEFLTPTKVISNDFNSIYKLKKKKMLS